MNRHDARPVAVQLDAPAPPARLSETVLSLREALAAALVLCAIFAAWWQLKGQTDSLQIQVNSLQAQVGQLDNQQTEIAKAVGARLVPRTPTGPASGPTPVRISTP